MLSGVLRGRVAEMYDSIRPYGFVILYLLLFTGALRTIIFPAADAVTSLLL